MLLEFVLGAQCYTALGAQFLFVRVLLKHVGDQFFLGQNAVQA